MATTLLSAGPATAILQNVVYALPPGISRVTSLAAVEVSIDGSTWTALSNAETYGAETGATFLRCPSGNTTVVVQKVSGVSSGGSTAATLVARSQWTHSDILVGATPKTIVIGVPGYVIVPLAWTVQRAANASTNYGTNASFVLRYITTTTQLGSFTPQLASLANKYYGVNPITGVTFNNTFTPSGIGIEIVAVNNTGGGSGLTVINFDITYSLTAGVAMP